ncbi:hypothetical protein FJ365_01900 [Candidatus Dependentiae bacterium]|nr:hypothetical protein [Candidatus Dependentiae bacterium]
MKIRALNVLFLYMLIALPAFAAQRGSLHHRLGTGTFSFTEEDEVVSATSSAAPTERLLLIINQAIAIAYHDKDSLVQLSPTDVTELFIGDKVTDPEGDAAKEWLGGCGVSTEKAATFLHSNLTEELLRIINIPLSNGKTAYELTQEAGCLLLARTIKQLSISTAT